MQRVRELMTADMLTTVGRVLLADAMKPPTCAHEQFVTWREVKAHEDDHSTEYGECRGCGAFLVLTYYVAADRSEWTVMTPEQEDDEADRYYQQGAYAERRTRRDDE